MVIIVFLGAAAIVGSHQFKGGAIQVGADQSAENSAPKIWPAATPGPYPVGYTILREYDHTRTFRPKYDYFGDATSGVISRPLQICVWYPADRDAESRPMKLKEYYMDQVTETDYTTPSAERYAVRLQHLKQVWPIEFRVAPEDRDTIRTRIESAFEEEAYAVKDALPAAGRFPLIVHMPGYNGSPSGYAYLLEYLASHGYVVAAVANMGLYRRNIDDESASLDAQARDLEFVVARMHRQPYVDCTRTGTTGMSWGGSRTCCSAKGTGRSMRYSPWTGR